ncbi:MAG TPA: hypothetical protein VMF08_12135 [Candidatus Sulfotelmatobacter sp.]|nr:hypothetical protein [Candidatus Sulfotelmatobacter sp.]
MLVVQFARPVESSGLLVVGVTFAFRLLAIKFNWKTGPVARRLFPIEPEPGKSPGAGTSATAGKTDTAPGSPPQKGQSPSDGHAPEK